MSTMAAHSLIALARGTELVKMLVISPNGAGKNYCRAQAHGSAQHYQRIRRIDLRCNVRNDREYCKPGALVNPSCRSSR